jgi:hypothetical protein
VTLVYTGATYGWDIFAQIGANDTSVLTQTNTVSGITNKTFVAPVLGAATGTSFQGIIGNVTPSTGAFTTLSATKATGGDAATFTNAAALNKTGYIYTDNRYVGLFTSANGGGSGFASDTSVPNAYIQVGGAAIVTAITTGAAVTGLLDISAATSGQIQFPATQNASTNANTLDDYEEGTWTPSVGGTATYTYQNGVYTKIGNMVQLSARFAINVIGTGSDRSVTGRPFTGTSPYPGSFAVSYFTGIATSIYSINIDSSSSTTALGFTALSAAGTSQGSVAIFTSSTRVDFGGTYS